MLTYKKEKNIPLNILFFFSMQDELEKQGL
jgi:hypothetical protein